MYSRIKNSFLFYIFTVFVCVSSLFLSNAAAQTDESTFGAVADNYTFETIEVPGIDFLAVTASSDFDDYAGYTKSADGQKDIAFTLIDDVFTTHDFPGSENTYFYALGNNGNAAGYYEDSEGAHHGVVLENGELRQYDFPGSIETEIYGISDATGAMTGNIVGADGVRRGFTGERIVEVPGATATYADFVNASGRLMGTYTDANGIFHRYSEPGDGTLLSFDISNAENLEFVFVHGVTDAWVVLYRSKAVGDVPRSYVGRYTDGLKELRVPDSVSTEGWNINQDTSVVGYYDTADGKRHGFVANPIEANVAPTFASTTFNYIFETIDVPGVQFLAVTASSDFGDYAGYTKSADGQKDIAFTLIDDVFTTHDFPGSRNTYFYALSNNGQAAGYYEDSDGLHHGVVLENGELSQYDFPNSVQTEIWGISDTTGALTGNFIGPDGIRRGFSGEDTIVEVPGALATYSDFVSPNGGMVGSFIDADGVYHPYLRSIQGRFVPFDLPDAESVEYYFAHGTTDGRVHVIRSKRVGDIPRTFVGTFAAGQQHEVQVPGSVSTEGYNINADLSVVGHYETSDGHIRSFVARLADTAAPEEVEAAEPPGNVYTVTLSQGLNMISVPLAPPEPMNAKALASMTKATTVITLDSAKQRFTAWTPGAPDDGFAVEGGKGYIINVPEASAVDFTGTAWTTPTEAPAAPATLTTVPPQEAWAFVVSGHLEGNPAFDDYQVSVRNLRTNGEVTTSVQGNYFAAATADVTRRSVVQVGDVIEVRVVAPDGNVESQTLRFKVKPTDLANAVLSVRLDDIGQPAQNLLLQNYPNPFNPETWIPYQLSEDSAVSIAIYDTTGQLIRTLSLGFQSAGFYNSQGRAAYWDGRNELGERVASGVYFYQLNTPSFHQVKRMIILK